MWIKYIDLLTWFSQGFFQFPVPHKRSWYFHNILYKGFFLHIQCDLFWIFHPTGLGLGLGYILRTNIPQINTFTCKPMCKEAFFFFYNRLDFSNFLSTKGNACKQIRVILCENFITLLHTWQSLPFICVSNFVAVWHS